MMFIFWATIAIFFSEASLSTTYQVYFPEMTIRYDDRNEYYVSIDFIEAKKGKEHSYHFFHGDIKTAALSVKDGLTKASLDAEAKKQADFREQNFARYSLPELLDELTKEPQDITTKYLLVVANILDPRMEISMADFDAIVSHFAVDKLIALELIEKGMFSSENEFETLVTRYMIDSNFDIGTVMKLTRQTKIAR